MVISICGDNKYKKILINKLSDIYRDKVIVCDYFSIKFNSVIDTEKYKYELLEISKRDIDINNIKYEKLLKDLNDINIEYRKIDDKTVNERIDKFLEENKNKIIILINDSVLNNDFYETKYFINSDKKILIIEKNIDDINYDQRLFDIVLNDIKDIDVRKLVKK